VTGRQSSARQSAKCMLFFEYLAYCGRPDNVASITGISPIMSKNAEKPNELQGWEEIARFLGLPVATAQRWQKSGMPVHRGGRYVYANPDELNRWLNRESPSRLPAHIATANEDLAANLKQALSEAKGTRRRGRKAA
jgi:hypothetical protein